jgi:hypothetical protein
MYSMQIFSFSHGMMVAVSPLIDSFFFFSSGATAPIWALAYLHETLRFTSVY